MLWRNMSSRRADHEKAAIEHVDDAVRTYGSDEESKSTWQTLKSNPKIIALCFFANVGPLMYGFDNLATSLCLSMPAFEYAPAPNHLTISTNSL